MQTDYSNLDWEQFDTITDGGAEDFLEIYREFVAMTPDLLERLMRAFAASDTVEVAKVAHQLKGSAANFGFRGVSELAARIEQDAKAGDLSRVDPWIGEAGEQFAKAVEAVRVKYPASAGNGGA